MTPVPGAKRIVNDVSIQVATANGSGSQTSNVVLTRTLFRMGVPVGAKNLFPSNIAGLPTWYNIRANKDGYIARKKEIDILVGMNADTFAEDVYSVNTGGVLIHESKFTFPPGWDRPDVIRYAVPFADIAAKRIPDAKLRKMLMNMLYVGVLAELLGFDGEIVKRVVSEQFKGKVKAIEPNVSAIEAGRAWAKENLKKQDPYVIESMDKTAGKIMIEGNAACALGSVFAGCTVVAWYPITPSSTLVEGFIDFAKRHRHDPETGKATYAVVQAEDELSSIGIVLGAGWAGARAMTATSGPGISLMSEFTGLGYYAEIPGVIFDVQRVGPATGLPTRTMQGDLRSTAHLSHGDTKHVMLFPANMGECFAMAQEAFDLAERLQTPVFVMIDLDLGMNLWTSDPFPYTDKPFDRGKVLSKADLERLGQFQRYRDLDGDAIPYRTLPGTEHPLASYFTRGSGHNESAGYTEKPHDYVHMMDRLDRKFETARTLVPKPEIETEAGAEVGLVAFGSTDLAMRECRDQLGAAGIKTDYFRLRAYPFTPELKDFVRKRSRTYVVEQNRDGQMFELIQLEMGTLVERMRSVRHYNGLPVDARSISDGILEQEGLKKAASKVAAAAGSHHHAGED